MPPHPQAGADVPRQAAGAVIRSFAGQSSALCPAPCAFFFPGKGVLSLPFPRRAGKPILVLQHCRVPDTLPAGRAWRICRCLLAGEGREYPRFRQNCFMGRDTQPCLPGPPGTKNRKAPLAPSCPCSPVFCGAASVRPALSAIPDRLGSGHGSGIFPCPPPRVRGCPPRWGRSRHRRPPQRSGRVRWPRQPSASLQSAPSCRRG